MKIEECLDRVLRIARKWALSPGECGGLEWEASQQQEALKGVEEFYLELVHKSFHEEEGRQKDISSIIATAKLVILHWDSGDLAGSVRCLDAAIKEYEGE